VTINKNKDSLEEFEGHMIRVRARKAKKTLQQVLYILFECNSKFQRENTKIMNCIMT